jgi:uncharacterized protein with ATP-grasp and redox domains
VDDLRGALETTTPDERCRLPILREAMAWLGGEFDLQRIPSYYITRVHRLLKKRTGQDKLFGELRERCNAVGLDIRARVAERLQAIDAEAERMQFLALWAIAANHLDFRTVGTGYDLSTEDLIARLEEIVAEGLATDYTSALLAAARRGGRVLYLTDNVGEIALDTLVVAELQHYGCQVTVAVKGGPITSDAVWDDAHAVGMHILAPIIQTGPDTLGLPLDEMSPEVLAELRSADLIISKGQANYYACSELASGLQADVLCLLRTKCLVAASSLGLTRPRENVAVQLPRSPLNR